MREYSFKIILTVSVPARSKREALKQMRTSTLAELESVGELDVYDSDPDDDGCRICGTHMKDHYESYCYDCQMLTSPDRSEYP